MFIFLSHNRLQLYPAPISSVTLIVIKKTALQMKMEIDSTLLVISDCEALQMRSRPWFLLGLNIARIMINL